MAPVRDDRSGHRTAADPTTTALHYYMTKTKKHPTLRSCDQELSRQYPRQAQAQDGEIWTCTCGRRFEHVCDEAEGCSWSLVTGPQTSESGKTSPP